MRWCLVRSLWLAGRCRFDNEHFSNPEVFDQYAGQDGKRCCEYHPEYSE